MPRGTDPQFALRAARDFAKAEPVDHRYVMVLHDHQAKPHVHLSVRAESRHGKRLNPRKADLHRWRENFAEKLRGWGVRADATRQITRAELHPQRELWQTWARDEGRLRRSLPGPDFNFNFNFNFRCQGQRRSVAGAIDTTGQLRS